MERPADRDFNTAILGALVREAGQLARRGTAGLSSRARELAPAMPQFVLVHCKPLAAALYLVDADGVPRQYYRETGDAVPDAFAHVIREFVTAGMNELATGDRRGLSRRLEVDGIRLAVLIESETATVRGLILGPEGGLPGSEELFSLALSADA